MRINIIIFFFFFLFIQNISLYSESMFSANNVQLKKKINKSFSFLISGHVYGSHNRDVYPASSLLANIDLLNSQNVDFMFLLGDHTYRHSKYEIVLLKESFLNKLNFPIFMTIGNHDSSNIPLYKKYFGETYFRFKFQNTVFISIDVETDNDQEAELSEKQRKFLDMELNKAIKDKGIKNVFILSHRLIWAIENKPYNSIIPFVNGPYHHPKNATGFKDYFWEKLKAIKDKKIFLASGDIGCKGISIFYEKDQQSNITCLAAGVGDTANDAFLKVEIDIEDNVKFTPISLTNKKMNSIESYDLKYWERFFKELEDKKCDNQKKKLLCVVNVLKQKTFWLGIFFGFLLMFFTRIFKKR